MLLQRAVPPGEPVAPADVYGDLRLEAPARPDRPHVVANLVSTADGKATVQGRSTGLGGPADRAAFHLLRSQVDAVLAGTSTMRVEHYGRLVRDPELQQRRVDQGRSPQPLGVVISASGDLPWAIPLFEDPDSRIALFAPPQTEVPATAAKVALHPVDDAHDLPGVLARLRGELGVRSLLCEGGPRLLHALLEADRLDELFLTLAPVLAGGTETPLTVGTRPVAPMGLALAGALHHEGTLLLRYTRTAEASP